MPKQFKENRRLESKILAERRQDLIITFINDFWRSRQEMAELGIIEVSVGQLGARQSYQKLNSFGKRRIMMQSVFRDISNRDDSATHMESESIFEKYRQGRAHSQAPFRLFETNSNTSCEEDSDSESHGDRKIRGPYRKYTYEEKMQAVERILAGEDVKIISKESGIPRRNLLRWKKNGCERKEGGGRPTDSEMESLIFAKIKRGDLTDQKSIRKFAIELSKTNSFKASKGWFVKFCHRYNISLGQNPDDKENMAAELLAE